jgi:PadR family transcriptional regulator, regulatory protein PadR
MKTELVRGPLDLLILSILRSGPAHGYAIILELAERSGGAFNIASGAVYPVLHRLNHAGLVSGAWDTPRGRRRRLYTITDEGRDAFVGRDTEWRRFVTSVDSVLHWSRGAAS